ncbi:hypothetical protein Syun_011269 [Stephania yunnanensis]|uniref:Uncharacterized protein n=1 Tax=Stephania yunnanensis TaxID=152371 RepID=A0AAP0JXY1_9MAGN
MIPETQSRRSRGRLAAAEESSRSNAAGEPGPTMMAVAEGRGGNQRRRRWNGVRQRRRTIAEATSVAGTGGHGVGGSRRHRGQQWRFEKRGSNGGSKQGGSDGGSKKGPAAATNSGAEEKIAHRQWRLSVDRARACGDSRSRMND